LIHGLIFELFDKIDSTGSDVILTEVFDSRVNKTEFEQIESEMIFVKIKFEPFMVEVVKIEPGDKSEFKLQLEHNLCLHFY
jgi:hypothetical protein